MYVTKESAEQVVWEESAMPDIGLVITKTAGDHGNLQPLQNAQVGHTGSL